MFLISKVGIKSNAWIMIENEDLVSKFTPSLCMPWIQYGIARIGKHQHIAFHFHQPAEFREIDDCVVGW